MTKTEQLNASLIALIAAVVSSNPSWGKGECVAWAIDGICEQYELSASDERHLREVYEVAA